MSRSSDRDRGAQEAGALAHQPTHAESWEHARVNPAASSPHELATRTTFEFVSRYWDVGRGEPPSDEPPRILEVGCGDGRLAELLTAHGCQVLAVDSEPSAVDRARARGIAAACTEWPKFELPAATRFDLILFTRSLHHISDLEGGVRRARELLRPGGRLLVEELALEDVDESWITWLADRARSRNASGELSPDSFLEALMTSASPLHDWRREHHHEPALHTATAMRIAVEANFVEVHRSRVPYLFRYLLDGLGGNADGAFIAYEEMRREIGAADERSKPLIGARFVATIP